MALSTTSLLVLLDESVEVGAATQVHVAAVVLRKNECKLISYCSVGWNAGQKMLVQMLLEHSKIKVLSKLA